MTTFWKSLALITSGGMVSLVVGMFTFWGDWTLVKANVEELRRIQGGVSAPPNSESGAQISGTMLSEAVGTRKNLEFIRDDLQSIRDSMQVVQTDLGDIKQRLVIELNGRDR